MNIKGARLDLTDFNLRYVSVVDLVSGIGCKMPPRAKSWFNKLYAYIAMETMFDTLNFKKFYSWFTVVPLQK